MFADIQHLQLLAQGGATPVPIYFGATMIAGYPTANGYGDDAEYTPTLTEGMFNNYASINAQWVDTTDLDNFRADGTGNLEVNASTGSGFGNTQHTYSTNATTY